VPLSTMLFSFEGRMRRSHWWAIRIVSTIAFFVVLGVVYVPLAAIFPSPQSDTGSAVVGTVTLVIALPVFAAYMWIDLATSVKRLHDQDLTGWFTLLFFVPYLGSLAAFIMLGCLDGTKGPNKFGPSEKYPTAIAETFA
jgi:uncharacterized membrane protein YhaH (DUF805 family)